MGDAGADDDAVVVTVSNAVAIPFAGSANGASMHVIFWEAAVPHVIEPRMPEPASPFLLVNVSVVAAERPGAEIVSAAGAAVMLNVAASGGVPEPDDCTMDVLAKMPHFEEA
jgi:hypothetical protein